MSQRAIDEIRRAEAEADRVIADSERCAKSVINEITDKINTERAEFLRELEKNYENELKEFEKQLDVEFLKEKKIAEESAHSEFLKLKSLEDRAVCEIVQAMLR